MSPCLISTLVKSESHESRIQIILASVSLGRKQLLEKLGVTFTVMPSAVDEDEITHSNPIKMLKNRAKAKAEDVIRTISCQLSAVRQKPLHSSPLSKGRSGGVESLNVNSLIPSSYLIIAADSMAILRKSFDFAQDKAYGKAKTKAEGRKILERLMGKTHEFVTATSIIYYSSSPDDYRGEKLTLISSRLVNTRSNNKTCLAGRQAIKQWNSVTSTKVTMRKLNEEELRDYVAWFDFTRFAAGYAINEYPADLITKIDGSYTNVIGLPFEMVLPIFRKLKII